MGRALGIIGIVAGAILLIIGFLTIFAFIYANLSVVSLAIPVIILIVGALLVAYGNRSVFRNKVNSTMGLKNVFCRYCGKKTVSGEYCSACEKNSQSSSVTMKICRGCNSVMSDDSQYCANCGKNFNNRVRPQTPE
jgi:hypothetical protein